MGKGSQLYNSFLDSGEIFAVRVVLWTKLSSGFAGVIKLKTETVHCQKELVTCRKIKMYPTELKDIFVCMKHQILQC